MTKRPKKKRNNLGKYTDPVQDEYDSFMDNVSASELLTATGMGNYPTKDDEYDNENYAAGIYQKSIER